MLCLRAVLLGRNAKDDNDESASRKEPAACTACTHLPSFLLFVARHCDHASHIEQSNS